MRIEESHQRQQQLELYLLELASNPLDESALQEMANKLKELYSDGFRHNYSKFFPLIIEVFREDNQYNQDYLSTNLDSIRDLVEKDFFSNEDKSKCKYIGLYKPLTKLSDHINLEIGRYSHSLVREYKLQDLDKRNADLKEQLSTAKETLQKVSDNLQNAQKEYVAILGIFAAVVLAFTGGIAYSTSVFENLHSASIYRIGFASVLIGFTLFNLLFFLFTFIADIVHKQEKQSHKTAWIVIANVFLSHCLLLSALHGSVVGSKKETQT